MTAPPEELAALGIEEVRVVRLEPGDIICLSASKRLTMEEVDTIRNQAQAFFDSHRVVVLENGLSLEVVRKGGEPE